MNLAATLRGTTYRFRDLKQVLAKANEEKSGDRLAGLAADSVSERVAAKRVLADVTLGELLRKSGRGAGQGRGHAPDPGRHPAADLRQREVVDGGEAARTRALRRDRRGGAAAPVARADQRDDRRVREADDQPRLVHAARKIRVVVHATNTVGLANRLSIRLQPNHPSDSIEGILASLRDGLVYGAGDAVIGINPVTDDPGTTAKILNATGDFMRQWRIPTQNCCLAHVTTQMKALEQGRSWA
jgi:ethanolamine ammonia-lyase large subunit